MPRRTIAVFAASIGAFACARSEPSVAPQPSIQLTAIPSLRMGDSVRPSILGYGLDGATATAHAILTSSDSSILRITEGGSVIGIRDGNAILTAQLGTFLSTVPVHVLPAILVGAGDIAACGLPYAEMTARILDTIPGVIFTAGDNTYPVGAPAEWMDCYEPTWGRHKTRTLPSLGNHDVVQDGGRAYFDYWGPKAGPFGLGFYSVDLGVWHIVILNSNIDVKVGSVQNSWLKNDLDTHRTSACILAVWHNPRFASARDEHSDPAMKPLWDLLYAAGADVVIAGHAHNYERFAPQTPAGLPDSNGIREFVVGTGGVPPLPFAQIERNSETRQNTTNGVLKFSLYAGRYEWTFVAVGDQPPFADEGSAPCHSQR